MRRFLIRNEKKFTGDVELTYNDKGTISIINLSNCDMGEQTFMLFMQRVPASITALVNNLSKHFSADTTIVEADIEVTFDMFWDAYRKKINRLRCEKLWSKLDKIKQVKAFYGIHYYDKYLKQEGWRNKADPENYIKREMWDNEWS